MIWGIGSVLFGALGSFLLDIKNSGLRGQVQTLNKNEEELDYQITNISRKINHVAMVNSMPDLTEERKEKFLAEASLIQEEIKELEKLIKKLQPEYSRKKRKEEEKRRKEEEAERRRRRREEEESYYSSSSSSSGSFGGSSWGGGGGGFSGGGASGGW